MNADKAILTCALTGVLTDPKQHPVPVTPAQMAAEARDAFHAGAAVMHVHLRQQGEGKGHLPSWDPDLAEAVCQAIRDACPGVIINLTTGVIGPDISGPAACIRRVKPEIAACNAGSLNYLKLREDGRWAWPPMVFDNPVAKIQAMLDVMAETGTLPEFECFDVGIVRSVGMYLKAGMFSGLPEYNFVMGVASGMPCDAELLQWLPKYVVSRGNPAPGTPGPLPKGAEAPRKRTDDAMGAVWQATLIGRAEIWPLHQRVAELGGMLRTGLEDSFYLPGGERAAGNGPMIEALAQCARRAGREIASPAEARARLGLPAAA